MQRVLLPLIAICFFAPMAMAGPLEDADVAYKQGHYVEALDLLRPLAEQGNDVAQFFIGGCGGAIEKNEEVLKWYRIAAEDGLLSAQTCLANIYYDGVFIKKDHDESLKWRRRAAENGDPLSQMMLGEIFEDGDDVPQDYEASFNWFFRAAEQGYKHAQFYLGLRYSSGYFGAPLDLVQAYKWYILAASGQFPVQLAAKNRDELADRLTRAQIIEAQRLARDWKPKHEK
jgi:TPR repeat protein